jgi:predicted ABC-type exoprotein transport system permease subunit
MIPSCSLEVKKRHRTDGMQAATHQRVGPSYRTLFVVCRKCIIFNNYLSIYVILLILPNEKVGRYSHLCYPAAESKG